MSDPVIFRREGERLVPSAYATGPWGADRLHGGPVIGLLARAIEAEAGDPELVVTRLSVDLFRPVPLEPLAVRVDPLRRGSRLVLLQAALLVGEVEFARATALLLRASDAGEPSGPAPAPAGPEGLATESLMRGFARENFPPGFHTVVQTRWVPRADADPLAIWFHLPVPLVAGERASPLQCAVALSDFANAVANIAGRGPTGASYINADATLYLSRRPEGEWFCLQEQSCDDGRGISVAEIRLFDVRGSFGRALQARLANRFR